MDEFGLTAQDFVEGVDPNVENILDIIAYKEKLTNNATRLILCPTAYAMLREALGYNIFEDITRYKDLKISVEVDDEFGETTIDVC